ncbi:hypothetical protein [Bacillus pseudomycoides]|uniref:hypothetical protein n=1 Tax=Bacillus pseudomycoides TaxID=64104 RepID=UPI000BED34F1|nr:hypothetical protein [Bacillus pseudomycoides]PDY48460.1 hypothetical protein CON79_04380 [Bacillus pseudomycoides]PHB44225.1 hypothetical protein COE83_18885 [Bacillus pseudomycoides]
MEDIKVIISIVAIASGLAGVGIGATLNHLYTLSREKNNRIYDYKNKVYKEVYVPIHKILGHDLSYSAEYKGKGRLQKIENIVYNNNELVDYQLKEIVKYTKGSIYMKDGPTGRQDDWTFELDWEKLNNHVDSTYNHLRKELGIPNDIGVKID